MWLIAGALAVIALVLSLWALTTFIAKPLKEQERRERILRQQERDADTILGGGIEVPDL